jgi:hypothetical protein
MADLKEYEVTSEEFVTQECEVLKKGDRVKLDPKNGVTKCGVYFKQLKPAPKEAKATEREVKTAEKETATEPEVKAPAKKAAAKSSGTAKK